MWEKSAIRQALSGAGKFFPVFAERLRKRGAERDRRRASEHKRELAAAERAEAEHAEVRSLCDAAIRALHTAAQEEKRLKWNIHDGPDMAEWTREENGTLIADKRRLWELIQAKNQRAEEAYQEALQPATTALTAVTPHLQRRFVLSSSPSNYELEKVMGAVKQCRDQHS